MAKTTTKRKGEEKTEEDNETIDYDRMKVAELKEELKKKGLSDKGTKPQLLARLKGESEPAEAAPKKAKVTKKKEKEEDDEEGNDEEGTKGNGKEEETTVVAPVDFSLPKLKDNELKIVSWNVAGWKAVISKGFADYVKAENPDIICVQETKIDPSEPHWKLDNFLPGYHAHFYGATSKKGYSGTGIFSKIKPIQWIDGIDIAKHDTEGRCITAEYEKFYLVNTYIPNSGKGLTTLDKREAWDKDFLEFLKKLDAKKPVIWTGDLNVAHLDIDLANPKTNKNKTAGFTDKERSGMSNVLKEGFVDTFRHLYPTKEGVYSYWSYFKNARGKNIGWRLDYFIISQRLLEFLGDSFMRSTVEGSDHCPIVLHIALKS